MVAGAVAGKYLGNCTLLDLIAKIVQLGICQLIQVESADVCEDIVPTESQPDILQDICHPGMGAAAENGQTGRCVYYEALLVGKAVGMRS